MQVATIETTQFLTHNSKQQCMTPYAEEQEWIRTVTVEIEKSSWRYFGTVQRTWKPP